MPQIYKLFCSQVSGKEPKLLTSDQKIILKGYNPNEFQFYKYLQNFSLSQYAYSLNQFVPQCTGSISLDTVPIIQSNDKVKDQKTLQWLQHLKKRYEIRNPDNDFLKLQNLTYGYKRPNVLDIKLGTRDVRKPKKGKKPSKYFFILNGCRINVKHFQQAQTDKQNYQILFFSKYFYKTLIQDEQILEHLALYFFDGQKLRIQLLNNMVSKLRQLILLLKSFKGWKFFSTSLCFFYDAQDQSKFDVKLIDFGRSAYTGQDEIQQAAVIGLENLHRFLMDVLNKSEIIEDTLSHMKKKYLKEAILIIPDNKIKQYESSRQPSETNSPKKQPFSSSQLPEPSKTFLQLNQLAKADQKQRQ